MTNLSLLKITLIKITIKKREGTSPSYRPHLRKSQSISGAVAARSMQSGFMTSSIPLMIKVGHGLTVTASLSAIGNKR